MFAPRQIQVSITSGVLTNDVADLAMGLLLAGSRNLCQGDRFVRDGRWEKGGACRWPPR
ncbi:glyoxylate reductase [Raoultella planticola]|uniref:Glyoxylate reductase n=1 Tax=Raoultella planticola TaxID=575 RepID=A0A485B124_RAOPL|nr:glyoxylate reductase [Raoultella planticola]